MTCKMQEQGLVVNEAMKKFLLKCRNDNKIIVATCGCFSLLHPGHIELLQMSRQLGDVLIVGINTDRYISNVKRQQLVYTEQERLQIIQSIRFVDYAYLFDADNFSSQLEIICPDIFTKGPERKGLINAQEYEVCKKRNITIKYIGDIKKYTASQLASNK